MDGLSDDEVMWWVIAMDCKTVLAGEDGEDAILARVSIVNYFGNCVYDKFVKPTMKVTNYQTEITGIRPEDLEKGEEFKIVRKEVQDLIIGKIIVGHTLKSDLKYLLLPHPRDLLRETSTYSKFRKPMQERRGEIPTIDSLIKEILDESVVDKKRSSIQDAKIVLRLYKTVREDWERDLLNNPAILFAASGLAF